MKKMFLAILIGVTAPFAMLGIGYTMYKGFNLIAPLPKAVSEIEQPAVVIETLDPSLAIFAPMWQMEIGRRFPHAVGILVHGADFVEGQWIVGTNIAAGRRVTPVVEIVKHYQRLYPTRTVVLLACNTGHLKLGIPGVYYAKSSVWCVPDRFLTPEMFENELYRMTLNNRWSAYPDVVGNIYEFVKDD